MQTTFIADGHAAEFIPAARALFEEYADWLKVDLCFQNFKTELETLPGKYAPPAGALLLAYIDDQLAGCVAMRPLASSICEMKRLWVRERYRGMKVGEKLVNTIIDRARAAGYLYIRLDTLPHMTAALKLYQSLGFYEIPPYYATPLMGTVYLEKQLT